MPSAKKHRRQTLNYKQNKKRLWKKVKRKTEVHIPCKQIKGSWDSTKSMKQNLSEMGIAVDPNSVMPLPKSNLVFPTLITDIEREKKKPGIQKPNVVKEMEVEADLGEREKKFQLPVDDVFFCTYMLDKYKEDYKAMARDSRNAYQLTPKQVRNKIREFKRSKLQYQKYLDSKHDKTVNKDSMET
ncbi:nucleolar protein 16 [Ciona intestinalis]